MGSAYLIRTRAKADSARKFANTDEFVQWLANEAVKDAWEQNHVKLDYSVESIKNVEKILRGLHDQYTKDPSTISVKGLGSAYGAYIGEVIRRSEPGARWQRDDETGEKSYPIIWGPALDTLTHGVVRSSHSQRRRRRRLDQIPRIERGSREAKPFSLCPLTSRVWF